MVICKSCNTKVKSKFCPGCGVQVDGDNDLHKWISDTEGNMKFWVDKARKIDPESEGSDAVKKKCESQIVMYRNRISILKDMLAKTSGQEVSE